MPNREDVLRDKTFKDVDSSEQRVLYTLWGEPSGQPTSKTWTSDDRLTAHRTAKLIGLIVSHLQAKGMLDETELDEMLFQAIQ